MPKYFRLCLLVLAGIFDTAFAQEAPRIAFPQDAAVVLAVEADGVQIYEAKPSTAGGFKWALKAPEAELKNLSGATVGKHFGGPSWMANDGSQVVGALPPLNISPAGTNVPWLVLAVKSKSGSGLLAQVDYVARISTEGGNAPAEAPKAETDTVRVKYRAIYLFFQKT
jgi:hypothetical protein